MLIYILVLVSQLAFPALMMAKSISSSSIAGYPTFCLQAAYDNNIFKTFRSHVMCRTVVENVGYNEGLEFEKTIQNKYRELLPYLSKIGEDDKIGSPVSHYYESTGLCSPVTLRYVKIAGDLQREFLNLSKLHIVEIGGGFGGQCKVLSDTFGFASYTIIDLPECTPLINKYLAHFNIKNTRTISSSEIYTRQRYDLVISNYAFSEIDREEQLNYIETIINLAPMGYITYNLMPEVNPLTKEEFVSLLLVRNKHRILKIERESPSTCKDNFVIIWYPKSKLLP